MVKLVIKNRLPSLNEYTSANRGDRGKYVGAKMKKDTENLINLYIKEQIKRTQVKTPVKLHIRWYEPNSRRDADNIVFAKKFILDALVKNKVIPNDNQKHVKGFSEEVLVDKDNPRIEVEICEMDT